jgi:L-malate glycosyltransferase
MRICYLADGRFIHAQRWLRYFSERGLEMHLVSSAPMEPQHVAAVEATGARYLGEVGGFHLKRFWLTGRDLLFLRRLLRRERIDLLHCHFLGTGAWFGALSRFHPFVLTILGGDINGSDWEPNDNLRERLLSPFTLRNADLITCHPYQLTQAVKRFAETRVEILHCGVNLARFSPGPRPRRLLEQWKLPPNAKVVLSPRLLRSLYNIDTIATAAREVCAAFPNVYFLFAFLRDAVDKDYENRVRAIVEADPFTSERVRFIGEIPHEEMADYYRLADVIVSIPSHDGTALSVLESMACDTPVVVSRISDYDPYYIEPGETVLAVNPNDSTELAAALVELLRNPELATRLSAEARRRVEASAGDEAQVSRMEQLYHELCGR